MSAIAQIARIIRYVSGAVEVARHAVEALRRGDTKTVDEILPETLATTTAKAAADAAALARFGADDTPTVSLRGSRVQSGDDDGRA